MIRNRVPTPRAWQPWACAIAFACALAACTPGRDGPPVPADATPAAAMPGAATPDGLDEDDLAAAALDGELACGFSRADGELLLLARGDVGRDTPSQAVVRLGARRVRLEAPGGFHGMTRAPVFTGDALSVRIERTGPPVDGGESPAHPATLVWQPRDGGEGRVDGQWRCGP